MEIQLINLAFAISIFLTMFVGIILPTLLTKTTLVLSVSQLRVFSCFNCIAGGIFLGMCFLGVVPTVQDTIGAVMNEETPKYHFPLAEFVIVMGFFLVLAVEQFVNYYISSKMTHVPLNSNFNMVATPTTASNVHDQEEITIYSAVDKKNTRSKAAHLFNASTVLSVNEHSQNLSLLEEQSGIKLIVLLVAICINSLFEGLALGLQIHLVKALHLFVGIVAREFLVASALGMSIAQRRPEIQTVVKYAFGLSVIIPFGIALGVMIQQAPGAAGNLTSGILQGFAAGIFLYVIFLKMIPMELGKNDKNMTKVMFFFIGFLLISILNLLQQTFKDDDT